MPKPSGEGNSIRIYTLAEGDALTFPERLSGLNTIATATGGLSFAIREASEMAPAFETIVRPGNGIHTSPRNC